MQQDELPTTSKDDHSEPGTSSVETWWNKLKERLDPKNMTPSQRASREKALAELHQAIYEAEQGLPNSTNTFVRL